MPALLCTLGTSWAVLPEAYLLGNDSVRYEKIYAITTSNPLTHKAKQKCEAWFQFHAPQAIFRVIEIEGLPDLSCSADHQRFEDALYRVYFAMLAESLPIHVCLAGGFKTMSASAQEAAGLMGCDKLFHIIAEPLETMRPDGTPGSKFPDTAEEIESAILSDKVKVISLGSRAGWPTIRDLAAVAEPLPQVGEPFISEGAALANRIHLRVEAANRLAASEPDLARLPFPQLARWSPSERASLNEPLDPYPLGADAAWLLNLPKIELHCHLGHTKK